MMAPLDPLASETRWVAWRNELRGGKQTKVPYAPGGGKAKADDPATWGTRADAKARAAKIINGGGGGIGIELGDLGVNTFLAGIDLDCCLTVDCTLSDTAGQILAAVPSYTEVSPSGRGLKVFFYCAAEDVRPFLELMGIMDPKQWGLKRSIGEGGGDHGPAIEIYFAGRFFTVTGDTWPTQPDEVTSLGWPALERLADLVPPPNLRSSEAGKVGRDNSRSAIAFRKGTAAKRAGSSFDEMVEVLRTDPQTADWVREKGIAHGMRELRRIWDNAAVEGGSRRSIVVRPGQRHAAADEGLAAMEADGTPFYQRDGSLVRVCRIYAKISDGDIVSVPAIREVEKPMLGRALGMAARWSRLKVNGNPVQIDPPKEVVEQIAAMTGDWPFPPLTGVIGTPTMRPDGSLLLKEGYDRATGLVLLDQLSISAIPPHPTREDAETALSLLRELLVEFPFSNEASRSVAYSALLTPVLRSALVPAVPMHIITAPSPGTGKSYLADLASMIAVGDRCAVQALAPDQGENEKRLIGAALAGFPIIALDNCSKLLVGDFLCQVTERPVMQVRQLGTSKMVRIPNVFTVLANGNNITVAADVVRRTLQCALDANMERPELREFKADPVAMIRSNRARYVAAVLTIARAYVLAGTPDLLPARPSFEGWSKFVRSALVWLGCADPDNTIAALNVEDPVRQQRAEVFAAWAGVIGCNVACRTKELVEIAKTNHDWRQVLLTIAKAKDEQVDPNKLGHWLRKNESTIAARYKLAVDRVSDPARPKWMMMRLGDPM